jgi:peptide/nickel transport system permease protein
MTGYLIRRLVEMFLVVVLSAVASYALLNFTPGGPLAELRQVQQNNRFRITAEDIARIRAYFELDLSLPVRFTRWLVGLPRGPLHVGGREVFASVVVGCRTAIETTFRTPDGEFITRQTGCTEPVMMKDLEGRRASRGVLLGDFGVSWRLLRDRPVGDLILSRLPKTLQLMGLSTLLSLLLAIPLGVYSAVRQYSRFDYVFTTLAFIGAAMPTFFFGIMFILAFSILPKTAGLPYLPPGSSEAVRAYDIPWLGEVQPGSVLDVGLHLVLPVAVLTIVNVAGFSRFVRASMLEVLRQDYVRTARAKGLLEVLVISKHALRNALIPFITIFVFAIPTLFAGAIITESIFSWPGMGRLFILALGETDYPVAMALLFITAVLTVTATLLADLMYVAIDPRIRLG